RLFRAGGVIGAFLMLKYLITLRSKTRRCLARTKKSPILQNSRKTSSRSLADCVGCVCGYKDGALMKSNDYPAMKAFIR
ncbi:MAG: hypothetical protein ACLU98_02295, partial [Desulfovibrio fairfieldensis]